MTTNAGCADQRRGVLPGGRTVDAGGTTTGRRRPTCGARGDAEARSCDAWGRAGG
jgi:hypothetical protein